MLNKRIISLILALLMLLTTSFTALAFEPASYDAGDEMFVDSGIESANYAYATNTSGSIGYTQDVAYVHSGSRALRFTVAGGDLMARHGRTDGGRDEMNAYLQEGVVYKLSFWAKADSGSTVFTFPGSSASNPYNTGFLKDVTTGSAPTAVVGSEWEKVELYITPNSDTTISEGLQYFSIKSSQPASLDEISLKPVSKYPEFTGVAIAEKNLINDPSMEAQKATALAGGGWSSSYVTEVADAPNGPTVLQTNGSGESWMQAAGSYLFNGGIEAGATYSFSFWAKMATEGATGSVTVRTSYYGGGTLLMSTSITDQWTKYTNVVTVAADSSILDFVPSGTIWFDNMNLIKLSDGTTMDLLNSSIESQKDCLPYDVDGASFTTKTLIDADTLSTVTIDNGGSVTAAIDEYGYKFNVSFDTIETGTTYTLDFSGVKDIYGQSLTTASYSFTTAGRAPYVAPNLMNDPTFELGKLSVSQGGVTFSNPALDIGSEAHSGTKVAAHTGTGGTGSYLQYAESSPGYYALGGEFEAGKTYYVSLWAKTPTEDATATIDIYSKLSASGNHILSASVTDEWQHFEGVATVTETSSSSIAGIPFIVNGTVYIDDFDILEVPAFGIESTTIDSSKDNLSAETKGFTVTTTAALNASTLSNITIDNGATISAVLNATDNWAFDVTLGNLAGGTTYTVDLSGVKDIYGQALTTFTFTTTGRAPVTLTNIVNDPTMEAKKAIAMQGGTITATYATVDDAPAGTTVLKLTGTGDHNSYMQANAAYLFGGGWQEGQTYRMSLWAKTETEDATATLKIRSQYSSGGALFINATVTDEWTYYEGIGTLGSEATIQTTGILGPIVNGTVLIDNFKIELLPSFGIESTTIDSNKDNLSADTTGFTVTTTAALNESTLANIAIDNGATISAVMNAEDNWAFDVTLGNIVTGTTYTVDLSGVKDIYGQALTTFTFTTSGRTPYVAPNLMNDPTFELGKLPVLQGDTGGSFANTEVEEGVAYSGTRVANLTGSGATGGYLQYAESNPAYYALGGEFEAGKTYYVSFWAKTPTEDATATIDMYSKLSKSGVHILSASVTDVWQHFEGVAAVTETSSSSIAGIPFVLNGTVYIDDFNILEVPAFTIESSSIDSNKDKLPLETTGFTITTTSKIDETTLGNIAINNEATISATLNKDDNYAFDVTLGNLVEGEKYTIVLSGVKDIYGQALTTFEFQIAGFKADDVVELLDLIMNPTLDGLTSISTLDGATTSIVDLSDGRGNVIQAVDATPGDGSMAFMRLVGTSSASGILKNHPWEAGKSYYVSFMAKASDSFDLVVSSKYYHNEEMFKTRVTTEWQQHTGVFTFDDDYAGDWAWLSFGFNDGATIYLDDLHVYELVDFEIVETSLGENTSSVATGDQTIEIVTTLPIEDETIEDISFSGTISSVEKIAENVISISFTGLVDNTLYSIDLSSVKDIYGQSMVDSKFIFRTISYFDIDPITFNVASVAAGDITATTTVTNSSATSENVALVLISYDSDGYIESINVNKQTVATGGTSVIFNATVTATDLTEYVIAYVWDWDDLAPWQAEVTLGK